MTGRRVSLRNGIRRHADAAAGIVALSRIEADGGPAGASKWQRCPARAPIPGREQRSAANERAPVTAPSDKSGSGRKH
jgi:hypothetical protein